MQIVHALEALVNHQNLSLADSKSLFTTAMQGGLSEAQFAGLLMALRVKGESAEELAGATAAMRDLSLLSLIHI